MFYCPYCGSIIKDDEQFCIQCGKKLPSDMYTRMEKPAPNRFWYLPFISVFFILAIIGSFYLFLNYKTTQAKELYLEGEQLALDGSYDKASSAFTEALSYKPNFPAAETNQVFMGIAKKVTNLLNDAQEQSKENSFNEALELIDSAENKLQNYNGEVVNELIKSISEQRNSIKLQQLTVEMNNDPTIEELKTLLWQAQAIKLEEATRIATEIRDRIIAYTFSRASELLNNKQFSDAKATVKEGLKYAPESDKLVSLKTTIEKEKTAFETAQQHRIEQAINAAEEEEKWNENEAVSLQDTTLEEDKQQNIVVKGKIKSLATVPITSVSIQYQILDKDGYEITSNEVFVNPNTIYPEENGEFEFTHYDIKEDVTNIQVKVTKIKWFVD
ncbi:zinc-ribbon domain-containing protein [Aquibacillus sp. 3ASR75-11]|uniref:Zinc-ribbon domain-containing protein n=1 Tax=Terrihalobacillus insolitus TaxID=2950438 RepID=A0A9X3WR58_9BACI|nr:zinc-ribbon domain-containing protein [Terrihalobacillus insolitus]MDC3412743.1 zinc-ribbon domain-containing protein [Terrihalobacillus insolitus]MDC3423780.1 zinc-ribbon domain-containing protein [Terrihalobacillus insolitus]